MNGPVGIPQKLPKLMPIAILARSDKYLAPMSLWMADKLCRDGNFRTAVKYGAGKRSHWLVSPTEVLEWRLKRHATQMLDN
jgi:hypothetical protein